MNWLDKLTGRDKSRPRVRQASAPTGVRVDGSRGAVASRPKFKSSAGDRLEPGATDKLTGVRIKLRSAFTPSTPVTDSRLFAGRTSVLNGMINALEDQRLHVIIYGERGIGKTSLLHVLSSAAKDASYYVVYVSCGSGSDFNETFRSVASEVPLLYHDGYSPTDVEAEKGGTLGDLMPTGSVSPRQVGDLFARVVGTRVLVVLDEFDRCESEDFRKGVAELMKNLSDRSARVQLVIAGVASDLTQLIDYLPSIRRCIFALQIPTMEPDEVRAIIEHGEKASGVSFEAKAADFIVHLANGSPYLASLLCHHSGLAALDGGRTSVSSQDVVTATGRTTSELRERISKRSKSQIDDPAFNTLRHVLGKLAGATIVNGGYFTPEDIQRTCQSAEETALHKTVIERLAGKQQFVALLNDEFGSNFHFLEDAVVPYLWLLAAERAYSA